MSLTRDPHKVVADSAEMVEARRQWNNILKLLKEKDCRKNSYIQQSYVSKMKEKERLSQINKSEENLLLVDLSYKKYKRKLFRESKVTPDNNLNPHKQRTLVQVINVVLKHCIIAYQYIFSF